MVKHKKLVRLGNSLALILDRSLLKRVRIDEATPLEVIDDGNVIIVSKAQEKQRPENEKGAGAGEGPQQ